MAFLLRPAPAQQPTRYIHDERSPATTSLPMSIPGATPPPIPAILRSCDTGPGRVHHHLDNISDYHRHAQHPRVKSAFPTWQEHRISVTEAQIMENRVPALAERKLGVMVPPGFGPRAPVVKRIQIVPEELPPWQNKRELSRWVWWARKEKKDEFVVHAHELEEMGARADSGYESV